MRCAVYTRPMPFSVLVLGGGFTGLEAARRLARDPGTSVTVVDPESHALFTPRLVDALAQSCQEKDLHLPHATLATRHGYRFMQGRATRIDPEAKRVDVTTADGATKTLTYDTLICAYGATTNFYRTDGREHAFTLKTWNDLIRLEDRVAALAKRASPLRIAIIGGGATGIEAACALDMRLEALGRDPASRTITVFQAGPQILPGFLPKTVDRTRAYFLHRSMEIRLGTPVQRLTERGLVTQAGEAIDADLVLWAAGVQPNRIDGDRITDAATSEPTTDYTLRLQPHLFAGGDMINLKCGQRPVPKNAQIALKMGALIAKNVVQERDGRPLAAFRYRSPGVMLWLGKTAITDLFGCSLPSPAFVWVRELFYRLRWRQLGG